MKKSMRYWSMVKKKILSSRDIILHKPCALWIQRVAIYLRTFLARITPRCWIWCGTLSWLQTSLIIWKSWTVSKKWPKVHMYPYSSQKEPIVNRDSNTKKLKNGVETLLNITWIMKRLLKWPYIHVMLKISFNKYMYSAKNLMHKIC